PDDNAVFGSCTGEETPWDRWHARGWFGSWPCQQRRRGMQDGPSSTNGFTNEVFGWASVNETDTVAIHCAQQHDQSSEFEQRLAFGLRAGAKMQGRRIFEYEQQRDLALFDELLAVSFTEPCGD